MHNEETNYLLSAYDYPCLCPHRYLPGRLEIADANVSVSSQTRDCELRGSFSIHNYSLFIFH